MSLENMMRKLLNDQERRIGAILLGEDPDKPTTLYTSSTNWDAEPPTIDKLAETLRELKIDKPAKPPRLVVSGHLCDWRYEQVRTHRKKRIRKKYRKRYGRKR